MSHVNVQTALTNLVIICMAFIGLISYQEFLDTTKQPDFEKDPGWESLDQKPVYTYEEYKEFERRRQEEVQRLIQQGLV